VFPNYPSKKNPGQPLEIDHHKHGHYFEADPKKGTPATFEKPHFHGPNGEHFDY
jgi:hypothetical protein